MPELTAIDFRTVTHQPDECHSRWHCHYHSLDEEGDFGYEACYECGHLYRTKRALRKAYRRMLWRVFADEPLYRIWRCLRVRVSRISHCPLCAHDL